MRQPRQIFTSLLLFAFSLFTCFQAIRFYQPALSIEKIQKWGSQQPDPITRLEREFDCIQAELTIMGQDVVGFSTSEKGDQHGEYFLLAQYMLVPRLVADSLDHPYIIGYHPGNKPAESNLTARFQVVKDCGKGLVLYGPEDSR